MSSFIKNAVRIVSALALCAAVSACSPQPIGTSSFPTYGASSSGSSASSIMDY